MKTFFKNHDGYTFVEILVTIAISAILLGFVTINLLNVKQTASLSSTVDTTISDIRSQELKALTGDTEGRGVNTSYGVYFGTTSYTLFHGLVYSPSDPSNFTVSLGNQIQFSTVTFPSSQVIFTQGTGEVQNFVSDHNTITIRDTSNNSQKTITVNSLGVITSVQ